MDEDSAQVCFFMHYDPGFNCGFLTCGEIDMDIVFVHDSVHFISIFPHTYIVTIRGQEDTFFLDMLEGLL